MRLTGSTGAFSRDLRSFIFPAAAEHLNRNPTFPQPIEPGHAFLLFPKVWHRYTPNPETGWHEHWIGFDGEIARRWLKHKFISPKNPVVKINAEDTVLATFSRIMQSIRANRPALQQILAGATDNLMGLFYSAQQAQPAADAQNANVIERAITRIQNEFDTRPGRETFGAGTWGKL